MAPIKRVLTWLDEAPRQLRGVRILQTLIGLVLLARIVTEAPFATFLWGSQGLAGASVRSGLYGGLLTPVVQAVFAHPYAPYAVHLLMGLGALGLIFGRLTRWATLAALVGAVFLEIRLPEITDGGDNAIRLALGYMLFLMPAGGRAPAGSLRVWLHNLAVCALVAQILVIYFVSGLMKAGGAPWHHGTALYTISQVEWFSHPGMRQIFTSAWVVTIATYGTVFFQVWFPVAVFSRLKPLWLAMGISMHLGIALFMGLLHFSTAMIALELFLVTDGEWARARVFLAERLGLRHAGSARWRVFVDGWCAVCRATEAQLHRLDRLGALETTSFRTDLGHRGLGLDPAALEARMHVVDLATGRVTVGFAAIQTLLRSLPLLWWARPVAAVLAWSGAGDRAYDALARRRVIVADARACDPSCAIDGGKG